MSGGSYNYICYKLKEECNGAMYDAEIVFAIIDKYKAEIDKK